MAYSEILADRIRQALAPFSPVKEQKMFGGMAFMVQGKMCVGAYSDGDMMIRCDPGRADEMVMRKGARHADMKGKPMAKGWLLISSEGTASPQDFDYWIGVALDFNQKNTR
ncbi:MAG TPA: TfoX/Sxy family protein [Ktedonobacteraceae bacterium]|nr:TfoX/Sxy family protein [Ktedonobacteraceae bacterium]